MAQVPHYPLKVLLGSPPYMSDLPEIVVRDLAPKSGERLRFLILATGGCAWPCLRRMICALTPSLGRHDRQ